MKASMITLAMVCAVLGFMTAAPRYRPRDCAVNTLSTTANTLQAEEGGDSRQSEEIVWWRGGKRRVSHRHGSVSEA
jgi:hypothetical protein